MSESEFIREITKIVEENRDPDDPEYLKIKADLREIREFTRTARDKCERLMQEQKQMDAVLESNRASHKAVLDYVAFVINERKRERESTEEELSC